MAMERIRQSANRATGLHRSSPVQTALVIARPTATRSELVDGLSSAGFRVLTTAADGKAEVRPGGPQPDLVIADLEQRRLVAAVLKGLRKSDHDLGVITISNDDNPSWAQNHGAFAHVTRPYDVPGLVAISKRSTELLARGRAFRKASAAAPGRRPASARRPDGLHAMTIEAAGRMTACTTPTAIAEAAVALAGEFLDSNMTSVFVKQEEMLLTLATSEAEDFLKRLWHAFPADARTASAEAVRTGRIVAWKLDRGAPSGRALVSSLLYRGSEEVAYPLSSDGLTFGSMSVVLPRSSAEGDRATMAWVLAQTTAKYLASRPTGPADMKGRR